jgi:NADPH-dependent glutamate synthase beta subunit-like oxidoreductase
LSGRRRPVPVKGSEFIVDCDVVIPAISQLPELGFLPKGHGLKTMKLGTLDVDPETLETSVQGVFAGGDAVTGPATVIEAIAGGQRAAVAIHNYIRRGEDRRDFRIPKTYKKVPRVDLTDEEKSTLRRPDMPHIPVTESKSSFREVVLDFDIEAAVNEAKRCLRCDLE